MSRFGNFRVPPGVPLNDAFAELPASVRAYLREGFSVLATLPGKDREVVLSVALESLGTGSDVNLDDLAQKLKLNEEATSQLVSAATVAALMVTSRNESPEQIVVALMDAKILDSTAKDASLGYLQQVVHESPTVRQALRRSRLGNKVLPSIAGFSSAIDVRVSFKNGSLDLAVPVAVVHLDTDAYDAELYFQMTKPEAEKLARQLNEVVRQLEEADQWAGQS